MSCSERCPQFMSVLIERFHCMYRVSNLEEWRGRSECDLHEVMPPLLQSVQPQSTLWTHPILTHPHPLLGVD